MADTPFADWPPPRKLNHEQARQEQRDYSTSKTPAERLALMTVLNKDLALFRGVNLDELQADLTPRRIPYRKS